jgi:diadenylate cyclase
MIRELVRACVELSKACTGALIVIERDTKLGDVINTGIQLNADVTSQLLINIFEKNTPLHDGAVVIRENRVKAATCYLPLTENLELDKQLGTRHRAGIGVTEVSDAVTLAVSEETGGISFIADGRIARNQSAESLRVKLYDALVDDVKRSNGIQGMLTGGFSALTPFSRKGRQGARRGRRRDDPPGLTWPVGEGAGRAAGPGAGMGAGMGAGPGIGAGATNPIQGGGPGIGAGANPIQGGGESNEAARGGGV